MVELNISERKGCANRRGQSQTTVQQEGDPNIQEEPDWNQQPHRSGKHPLT